MDVKNATSFSSNGLRDWLVQRVSAVILAVYFVFILGFLIAHPNLTYDSWSSLFSNLFMKIMTIIVLLSLLLHSWVGIWTVLTDYVKPAWLRGLLEVIVIIALIGYFIWGITILWNIQGATFIY